MTTSSPASMGGPLSERPRNQHCMNCGDTRGGPMGHETSECTYDSSIITAVRGALKPSHRLVLGRLVHDAQQDTYPLADADCSGGPYIVQGCVVNSAPQIQDAVRTIWKRVPTLLDELQAKRDEVKHLRTKAESLLTQNGVLVTEVRFQAERADGFREERDAATARVGVLEGQLATAQRLLDEQRGATRVAAAAADRFRDVLSEALGHPDENPGDDVLVVELRKHFGFSGPEPTRWRDFLTGARAQIDQIKAASRALGLDGGGSGE